MENQGRLQTLPRFEMFTISVRSEAAGCALGNEQARPANEDEKEPQFDTVRQADSLKALKFKQLFWKLVSFSATKFPILPQLHA
jgi:hypothetical protein